MGVTSCLVWLFCIYYLLNDSLIFQCLHRCGDAAAAVDHNGGAVLADGHDGGVAQQAAKVQNIAGFKKVAQAMYEQGVF